MTATVTPIRSRVPDESREVGEGLTGPQVCVLAGITYRQLDHWTRTGTLHAIGEDTPGTGSRRGYSEAEARIAGYIKKLLDAGFMVRAAAETARQLVETGWPVILAGGLVRIDPAAVVDL
jgi:hypothetical protein